MINRKFIILIIFVLVIIFIFWIISNNLKNESEGLIETNKNNIYSNEFWEFSIELPFVVSVFYKDLENKRDEDVSIKVFEDNENGIFYIVPEYYYNINGDKVIFSLEQLTMGNDLKPFLGWKIIVRDIVLEDDIIDIIKENFGQSCIIDIIKENKRGDYEIVLKGEDWGKENGWGNCFINYTYKIIYSPNKNKIMMVVLGQECNFLTSLDPYCYDEDMINSLRFY